MINFTSYWWGGNKSFSNIKKQKEAPWAGTGGVEQEAITGIKFPFSYPWKHLPSNSVLEHFVDIRHESQDEECALLYVTVEVPLWYTKPLVSNLEN